MEINKKKELTLLSNWDKARNAVAICKTIDEVKMIKDQAEALRSYAKQAKEGLEVQNNIADIKLRAERKIGEFSRELPTKQGKYQQTSHDGDFDKTNILKNVGIVHPERYEAIASLPEKEFEQHIEKVKASNEELTTVGVIQLARKLNQPKKGEAGELPKGKYEVVLADCPWRYDSDFSRKAVEGHYPTMDLQELCDFGEKVKEISAKNCVLFLWATSAKLNWAMPVIEAWGFEYKSSMIWDKIKYNMGYYSSIRHEFLLIAGKGSSTPRADGKTVNGIDSVQSIAKSSKHSEKPEEFRKIIEKLYPGTKRIELFARKKTKGWSTWGNEI